MERSAYEELVTHFALCDECEGHPHFPNREYLCPEGKKLYDQFIVSGESAQLGYERVAS